MRTITLTNVFTSTDDTSNTNLYALLDVVDTSPNSNRLFTKNKVVPLDSFVKDLAKENTDISNKEQLEQAVKYYLDENKVMRIPPEHLQQVLAHKEEVTLTDILAKLSEMRSIIKYNPDFYKDVTGGYSFSDFTPDFTTARVSADKLIISNSKLNIVLVSTMEGIVNVNSFAQPMMRYVPFKLVKQGEIMYDYLEVFIDDNNREYLQSLPHIEIEHNLGRIPLRQYKPFVATEFTIKALVETITYINSFKSAIRALNYYGEALKQYITREEIYDNEWYRGEAVDDDYVSDEGTDRLEIWIKGRKKLPSTAEIFNATVHLGVINNIKMLVDSTVDIYNFEPDEELKDTVFALDSALVELYQKGEISAIVIQAMSALLKCVLYKGTPVERYEQLKRKKASISNMLNSLELKMLPIRKKIIDTCDGIDVADNLYLYSLGRPDGGGHDSLGIYSPEARETVMFRLSKIVAYKKEDSLTELPSIDTDPRSEL